jgi:hypothetical protein
MPFLSPVRIPVNRVKNHYVDGSFVCHTRKHALPRLVVAALALFAAAFAAYADDGDNLTTID